MRVAVLQEIIRQYAAALETPWQYEHLHWYESVIHFGEHWKQDAAAFPEMFLNSLHNKVNKRLWKRDHYDAKQMMYTLMKEDPEHGRQTFHDLFDLSVDVSLRLSKFDHHCELLLANYREKYPLRNDTYHGQDAQMISVYLAFRYPGQYAVYHGDSYRMILKEAESQHIPMHDDLPRFFIFCKTLYTLMGKHSDVLKLHKNRLKRRGFYREPDMLLITDLLLWFSGARF
jgi:hypothetical protein